MFYSTSPLYFPLEKFHILFLFFSLIPDLGTLKEGTNGGDLPSGNGKQDRSKQRRASCARTEKGTKFQLTVLQVGVLQVPAKGSRIHCYKRELNDSVCRNICI